MLNYPYDDPKLGSLNSYFIFKWFITSAHVAVGRGDKRRMRTSSTIHCADVIQFRGMFAAAAKSHCYTLRRPIREKPPDRLLYNHSVQNKSCLVLIPGSRCRQNSTTIHCRADEPVSCRRKSWGPKVNSGKYLYTKWCLFCRIIGGQLWKEMLWDCISKTYKGSATSKISACKYMCRIICMQRPANRARTQPVGHVGIFKQSQQETKHMERSSLS